MEDNAKNKTNKKNGDYTKWQREYFDAKTSDKIRSEAIEYNKQHPFHGKQATVI